MRTIKAERRIIPAGFDWWAQVIMEPEKVEAIRAHMRVGGALPPPVLLDYGGKFLPIDGHHRTYAHDLERLPLDAWVASGRRFDNLSCECRDAEKYVLCDGVPALEVANAWQSRLATKS